MKAETDKTFDKYDFIKETKAEKPESVMLPLMVNPCSYESVEFVFSSLTTAYGSSKKCIAAGCDGSPYTGILGNILIDTMFVCPSCKTDWKGVPNFKTHMKEHDVMIDKELLDTCRKYKNIFLIPGSGHIEINMVKRAFKLFWYVF